MGSSINSKSLGVSHIVAISKLHQLGKLPKAPLFEDILKKVLPTLEHKIPLANKLLLGETKLPAIG